MARPVLAQLLLLLAALCMLGVQGEKGDGTSSMLAVEKGVAAAAAKEGRDLARAEGADAGALNRREREEEKRLEKELAESKRRSPKRSDLSKSDLDADAKVRLVVRDECARARSRLF